MQNKLDEGLASIKKARDYVKEGNYAFAQGEFVKGLGILHQVYLNEKDPKRKQLLKKEMNIYIEEAEENKKNSEKKQQSLQQGWFGFPAKTNLYKTIENPKPEQPKPDVPKPPQLIKGTLSKVVEPEVPKPKNDKATEDIQQYIVKDLGLKFSDIVGMDNIRRSIQEAIVLPRLRPDLFQGIRSPPRGILLYGPPGNGKTFIAKVIASEAKCTFFNLSASSLLSKYVGDSQKMLKKIFAAAYDMAPSIIFVDEVDSILTSRKENEAEYSRRLKTQFLTQMEGLSTSDADKVTVIAATNLPQELDKAALRRFGKKIYIDLPNQEARKALLQKIISQVSNNISKYDLEDISKKLQYYSASDINCVAAEACNYPVRQIEKQLKTIDAKSIRKVNKKDFLEAIQKNPPTLSPQELKKYQLSSD